MLNELKNRKHTGEGSATEDVPVDSETGTPPQIGNLSHKHPDHHIHIAPLDTPMQLRLETLAIIWHTISIPFFLCLFLLLLLLGVVMWGFVIIPYLIWWYGIDLHTPTNGKAVYRVKNLTKNLKLWKYFVNYYPIRVYKKVDFEPTFTEVVDEEESTDPDDEEDLISEKAITTIDKVFGMLGLKKRINQLEKRRLVTKVRTGPRYIFGYHPHGVISMGAMGLFGTNALRNEPWEPPRLLRWLFIDTLKGKRLLPGIANVFPLTLTTQFTIPFYRDYLLSLGLTLALAKNIKSLINNGDNSVCIVVGGARESLLNSMVSAQTSVGRGYTGPDPRDESEGEDGKREMRLVLKNRKGFVKLAIELGNISLVPTFAFGEVDIYKITKPRKDSWGYNFQQWLKQNFQFTLPFFLARGVFIYDFGFLPYRNPINICMGRPIHIPANTLSDWKRDHPEEAEELEVEQKRDELKVKQEHEHLGRSSSFSSLFKLQPQQPHNSLIKEKLPPALLDHYHTLYVEELKRVYEENKDKFGYSDVELVIQ